MLLYEVLESAILTITRLLTTSFLMLNLELDSSGRPGMQKFGITRTKISLDWLIHWRLYYVLINGLYKNHHLCYQDNYVLIILNNTWSKKFFHNLPIITPVTQFALNFYVVGDTQSTKQLWWLHMIIKSSHLAESMNETLVLTLLRTQVAKILCKF